MLNGDDQFSQYSELIPVAAIHGALQLVWSFGLCIAASSRIAAAAAAASAAV